MVALIISGVGILLIIVLVIIEGCQAQSGKSQQGESGPDDHGGSAKVGPKAPSQVSQPPEEPGIPLASDLAKKVKCTIKKKGPSENENTIDKIWYLKRKTF